MTGLPEVAYQRGRPNSDTFLSRPDSFSQMNFRGFVSHCKRRFWIPSAFNILGAYPMFYRADKIFWHMRVQSSR